MHVVDIVWNAGWSRREAARCGHAQSDGRDDDGSAKCNRNQRQSRDGCGSADGCGRAARDVGDFSAMVEVADVVCDAV